MLVPCLIKKSGKYFGFVQHDSLGSATRASWKPLKVRSLPSDMTCQTKAECLVGGSKNRATQDIEFVGLCLRRSSCMEWVVRNCKDVSQKRPR
jgi:hypothetical protein